jgi:hypothetical protein
MSRTRSWATAILVALSVFVPCGAAYAAAPHNAPNSVASHNSLAPTFAPHGGQQRDPVLEWLRRHKSLRG